MTIKQMAILNVAKIIAVALLAGLAVNLGVHYLGLATVGVIMALALFVYMIKFAYDIELSKLESKNALSKLRETK
jgi:Flp pilus assembly protein TadB